MNPIPALLIGIFSGLVVSALLAVAAAMLHGRCEHEEHPLLWMDDYDGEYETFDTIDDLLAALDEEE